MSADRSDLRLVLIGGAAIALGAAVVMALWWFSHALLLIVLAATLASALEPLVCRFTLHVPRTVAVVVVYLALAGLVVAVGAWVTPSIVSQLEDVFREGRARDLTSSLRGILPMGSAIVQSLYDVVRSNVAATWSSAATASVDVVAVVFLSLYMLLAAPAFREFLVRLAPPRQRRRVERGMHVIAHAMGGYFRGAAINGVVIGLLTWAALTLAGVELAGPLGIIAGFGELIPYLGPVIAAVPAVAVALTESPRLALVVIVLYVAIQQIEGHVLTPLIMHRQTAVSPAVVIAALLVGYAGAGIIGALAAIPIFAATRVIVVHEVAPALRRRAVRSAQQTERSGALRAWNTKP